MRILPSNTSLFTLGLIFVLLDCFQVLSSFLPRVGIDFRQKMADEVVVFVRWAHVGATCAGIDGPLALPRTSTAYSLLWLALSISLWLDHGALEDLLQGGCLVARRGPLTLPSGSVEFRQLNCQLLLPLHPR